MPEGFTHKDEIVEGDQREIIMEWSKGREPSVALAAYVATDGRVVCTVSGFGMMEDEEIALAALATMKITLDGLIDAVLYRAQMLPPLEAATTVAKASHLKLVSN